MSILEILPVYPLVLCMQDGPDGAEPAYSLFDVRIERLHEYVLNHGPGAGSAGLVTSAITLKQGAWTLSVRLETTEFESVPDGEIAAHTLESGGFDALDRSLLTGVEASLGVTEDLTLSASFGFFDAIGFREGELEMGSPEIATGNPDGLTDLWLQGKFRLVRSPEYHLAVLGGVKFPTGRNDSRNSHGEVIEAVEQPGTGSTDFAVGIAYTTWLTERLTLDAGARFVLTTEGKNGYKIGNRIDAGAAPAYRLTEDVQAHPQWVLFGELSVRNLRRDEEDGATVEDSGGTTFFVVPGITLRSSPTIDWTLSVPVPVMQNLHGNQQEMEFKVLFSVTFHTG